MNQPVGFGMLEPSAYGPILVNRYDTNQTNSLIKTGVANGHKEILALCGFLQSAPMKSVALDVGANFGFFALAFARLLAPRKGVVHAFEAQRMIAYLAAGTVALNGVENLFLHHKAVGAEPGKLPIPQFNYNAEASFGSIEFGKEQREFIGQARKIEPESEELVEVVCLDQLGLNNVALIKIDVEGMEEVVLAGAQKLIERDRPVLFVEWLKSDKQKIVEFCKSRGYRTFELGINVLAVHKDRFDRYNVSIEVPEI